MSDETQLSECLKAITKAVAKGAGEIEAARLALKERESQVGIQIAALVSDLAKVVFASNSQALRQKVIRSLYWDAKVRASLIGEAFGVNEHKVHSIAGPLIELIPCEGRCGTQVERIFRSQSARRDTKIDRPNSKARSSILCGQCAAKAEAKRGAEHDEYEKRSRKEAEAYCAQYGHHWSAEDIGGSRAENGVDWVSNNRPIRLQTVDLLSVDNHSIVLRLFCLNWCGATMEKTVSAGEETPSAGRGDPNG